MVNILTVGISTDGKGLFFPSPPCTPSPTALRRAGQSNLPLSRWFDAGSGLQQSTVPAVIPHPAKSPNNKG